VARSIPASEQASLAPARRRIVGAAVLLAALAAAAVIGAIRIAEADRDRELRLWQTRLGIIADTRTAAVEDWLAAQFAGLTQIAENASLQLYMTALIGGAATPDKAETDRAHAAYLRNLLTVIAYRMGFAHAPERPRVDANVRQIGVAGLVLVARDGRPVAATDGTPPLEGRLADFIRSTPPGRSRLLDLARDATGQPAMGFIAPVFAVQAEQNPANQIGWVVGVKQVAAELYPLLSQPGAVWKTTEALLVRSGGAAIEYLSPTRAGDGALARTFAADTPGLAAAFAVGHPGGFAVRVDYRGREVLVTGRKISRAPWTLLYKIDRDEALGPGDARARRLLLAMLLAIAAVVAIVIAAWRHGTSIRAARAASDSAAMAKRYEAQSRFLKLVTDSQPSSMFIVDRESRYRFANRMAADRAGIGEADLLGKTLASVLGPAAANRYEAINRDALSSGERRMQIHHSGGNGDLRVVQSEHIPILEGTEAAPGIMVVEEDITAAVAERERRERTLRQLIDTLVAFLDRRDPHSADHSIRVSRVAGAIAAEMGLDDTVIRTAEIAGQLMNIGKALVPAEMLTRVGGLADAEKQLIRDSLECGAALLEGVEFDGPVVETLRQIHERWDGAGGPNGISGDDIMVTAQIVAAANAFVALTSPRAWREGMDGATAAGRLMEDSGSAFARRVVSALMNLVDNRDIQSRLQPPAVGAAIH